MIYFLFHWVTNPFQTGVYSLRKEFAPRGANSFLEELTLIEEGGKRKIVELVPLEVYPSALNQTDYYAQNLVITINVEQVPMQRV